MTYYNFKMLKLLRGDNPVADSLARSNCDYFHGRGNR